MALSQRWNGNKQHKDGLNRVTAYSSKREMAISEIQNRDPPPPPYKRVSIIWAVFSGQTKVIL